MEGRRPVLMELEPQLPRARPLAALLARPVLAMPPRPAPPRPTGLLPPPHHPTASSPA